MFRSSLLFKTFPLLTKSIPKFPFQQKAFLNLKIYSNPILTNLALTNCSSFHRTFSTSYSQPLDNAIYREAIGIVPNLSQIELSQLFVIIDKYTSLKDISSISSEEANQLVVILYKAGYNLRNAKSQTKALEYFTEALNVAKKLEIKDPSLLGAINSSMGKAYIQLNDLTKAEKHLEKANTIFKGIPESSKLPEAKIIHMFYMSALYESQGKLDKASKLLVNLESSIDQEALGAQFMTNMYDNLGRVFNKRQQVHQAIEYWQKGLDVAMKKFGEESIAARGFFKNLAIIFKEQHDFLHAQHYADQWLNASLKGTTDKDEHNIVSILSFLCELALQQGEIENAVNMSRDLTDALQYFPRQNLGELSNAYLCLTTSSFYENMVDEAQKWFDKSLETVDMASEQQKLSIAEKFVHWALFLTHNPETRDKAKELCNKAETIYQMYGGDTNESLITSIYSTRGIISLSDEKFEEAANNFSESLRLSKKKTDNYIQLEKTNHLLSLAHLKQDKLPEALEFQKESVQACETGDDASRSLRHHYYFLGELYVLNDMLDEGLSVFNKTLDMNNRDFGEDSEASKASVKSIMKILERQDKQEEADRMKEKYNIE